MEDTVDKVAERLARLEETVAKGFFDSGLQFKSIDAPFSMLDRRLDAMDRKIGVSVESLRADIKTVLETVIGFTEEMRRTTESIRQEHAADRR
jgi:hypothetical protein